MTELLPTREAADLVGGLTDYVTTTFALSDHDAQQALASFLTDPDNGMFRGPYVRLRLPFQPAAPGAQDVLDHYPATFPPYGHQAAAFARLTTKPEARDVEEYGAVFRRPQPTLVTTGTGSGKTEAFLYPILDHVARARAAGISGIKAIILYPMNALANDQAERLKNLLLTVGHYSGIRAALYTGERGSRTTVSSKGLITERTTIRHNPPDILLTNYKMLDMLLLRHEDAQLWEQSARSLTYIVLDEFHTYDGAQGTDVAMLLRRLGLAVKAYWPKQLPEDYSQVCHIGGPIEADRARPLGMITPVATSATLGGGPANSTDNPGENSPASTSPANGAQAMLHFAETVFGIPLTSDAIISETRQSFAQWRGNCELPQDNQPGTPRPLAEIANLVPAVVQKIRRLDPQQALAEVGEALFLTPPPLALASAEQDPDFGQQTAALISALKTHPLTEKLVSAAQQAISLDDLRRDIFPTVDGALGEEFLANLIALYSHARAVGGREAITVETHLWIRELSRIDSKLGLGHVYRWGDDGPLAPSSTDDVENLYLPAIYCRHCGKSGWAVRLYEDGSTVETDGHRIRVAALNSSENFVPMMHAAKEDQLAARDEQAFAKAKLNGLRYFNLSLREFLHEDPDRESHEFKTGVIVPVLTLMGHKDGEKRAVRACPACETPDATRFMGSAISTLTSVAISNIFGTADLDAREKKALVFTDSVQDAAHRAGYIQARSHTFNLRSALRDGFAGERQLHLNELVSRVIDAADAGTPADRFKLVPPELTESSQFQPFWAPKKHQAGWANARRLMRTRLEFDAAMEFGLHARLGRTLELTGSVVAEVVLGSPGHMANIGRRVWQRCEQGFDDFMKPDAKALRAWIRGVVVRMRLQGGINHKWLARYMETGGNRYHVWGGRAKSEGMPAFPSGRPAPIFPTTVTESKKDDKSARTTRSGRNSKRNKSEFPTITAAQNWYVGWTVRNLGVSRDHATWLVRELFAELDQMGFIGSRAGFGRAGTAQRAGAAQTGTHATNPGMVYYLEPDQILLTVPTDEDLAERRCTLSCTVCQTTTFGSAQVIDDLEGACCLQNRCEGTLERTRFEPNNFYRTLYESQVGKRVVAREHTSMLPDDVRREYETGFRESAEKPDAPNVLVATPTLEMGIDIGDLSCVMLASLPTSVASYVQRVGRAGRLTGNSLVLAFVRGRGVNLPKVAQPLSIINGEVTPPSTFLGAEEILRRQYCAYLGDTLAREKDAPHPKSAADVMNMDDGSYLATLSARRLDHLDEFLGQFAGVISPEDDQALRQWVKDKLPAFIQALQVRRNEDYNELENRREELKAECTSREAAMKAAEAIATDPRTDQQVREAHDLYRAALSQQMRVQREISELASEYWIGNLEAYGLFPNYTLLDDQVVLGVELSWFDENSGYFVGDSQSYVRGARSAIFEMVPGSTFYANGMAIAIDAVELGPSQRELQYWHICPGCGWIDKLPTHFPVQDTCPTCGREEINDLSQVIPVARLTKVSAGVRRGENTITDSEDERRRTRFEIAEIAELPAQARASAWEVKNTGMVVEYYRYGDVTWLNLSQRSPGAPQIEIAGEKKHATLFKLCDTCGQRDWGSEHNRKEDHRSWCRHRNDDDKHLVSLALARQMRTQGAALHLPAHMMGRAIGAIPTLKAALLLGLQKSLGGTPGQIAMMRIPSDIAGCEGIFVHDTVPGGTGYLAIFKDPRKVFNALRAALEVVTHCPCQYEERQACHQCLLPYAEPAHIGQVARITAESLLRSMLGLNLDDDAAPDFSQWEISEQVDRSKEPGESHLELNFRAALMQRLKEEKLRFETRPGTWGDAILFSFPHSDVQWKLEPQMLIHGASADFLLSANNASIPQVAIFTDGRAFHAVKDINRVEDDARKRNRLRLNGVIPWGLTHQDIEQFKAQHAPLATDGASDDEPLVMMHQVVVEKFTQRYDIPRSQLTALRGGSLTLLWQWMHNPDIAAWQHFAAIAPTFALTSKLERGLITAISMLTGPDQSASDAHTIAGDIRLQGLNKFLALEDDSRWWPIVDNHAFIAASSNPVNIDTITGPRMVIALDDRDDAIVSPDFPLAWRRWLLWSNIASLFGDPTGALITTVKSLPQMLRDFTPAAPSGRHALTGPWEELIAGALDEEEAGFFRSLADSGVSAPEVGEEIDGIAIAARWADSAIVVVYDEDDVAALKSTPYQIFTVSQIPEIATALKAVS